MPFARISAGDGTGLVYATGLDTQFGRIATGLGERQPETELQGGLRRFSYLLLWVALTLTVLIVITNLLLRRPVIDSVLFALAIAVGITPQLLPAVVSASPATGSRRLAKLKVLVKRLVCITCASTTSLKPVALRMGDRLHRRRIA
jgi:Mg2+-importing ATPase